VLDTITLRFTDSPDITIPMKGVTIFVGPNSSGKSLALRELENIFLNDAPRKIVSDFTVCWPALDEVEAIGEKLAIDAQGTSNPGHFTLRRANSDGGYEGWLVHAQSLINIGKNRNDQGYWAKNYLKSGILRLDGRSRFNLSNDRPMGDLLESPSNLLAYLFSNDADRIKVREVVKDAFGKYFVIDPTNGGTLRIRISDVPPFDDEQSLNQAARTFHTNATHIKDSSDGVQAFVGIVAVVLAGSFHTLLLDEPEAFLHPPLARKLGRHLATIASEKGASLVASTHSSDFLMGCVQASNNVRVIRLEYAGGKSRGRVVDPQELAAMLRSPLMRSANAVSGLFYDGVVVTESDNDRAFYAEIYHRLLAITPDAPSVMFVNAQNKQTIKDIVGPLRKFGVPAVGIPDLDFIKEGGATWTGWLRAALVPDMTYQASNVQRAAIKDGLDQANPAWKTQGGMSVLSKPNAAAASLFFDDLNRYGIFPVRNGEVEFWLKQLGVPGKKTEWAVSMLERLGSDPDDPSYVPPGDGDVWDFMRGILAWVGNPARQGTL
jgi:energy-coupling factor transporter ATP-binding protein EcfA2